jgi:hypothetical protein
LCFVYIEKQRFARIKWPIYSIPPPKQKACKKEGFCLHLFPSCCNRRTAETNPFFYSITPEKLSLACLGLWQGRYVREDIVTQASCLLGLQTGSLRYGEGTLF